MDIEKIVLFMRDEGVSQFRLEISDSGKISSCHVLFDGLAVSRKMSDKWADGKKDKKPTQGKEDEKETIDGMDLDVLMHSAG